MLAKAGWPDAVMLPGAEWEGMKSDEARLQYTCQKLWLKGRAAVQVGAEATDSVPTRVFMWHTIQWRFAGAIAASALYGRILTASGAATWWPSMQLYDSSSCNVLLLSCRVAGLRSTLHTHVLAEVPM
jgi:hypothetical protein